MAGVRAELRGRLAAAIPGLTSPQPHASAALPVRWLLLLWAVLFVTLVVRRADAVLWAQFFAEDGTEWFTDAYNGTGGLLKPYAGYCHVIPRAVAAVATLLPVPQQPLFYSLCAFAIAATATSWFALPHFRHVVASDALRATVCVLIAAWPGAFEIVGTITNVQWYLGAWGFLVCIQRWPRTTMAHLSLVAAFVVALASAPNLLVLTPLLFVRAVVGQRSRLSFSFLALATVAYGLWLALGSEQAPGSGPGVAFLIRVLALVVPTRVFGICVLGLDEMSDIGARTTSAVVLASIALPLVAAALWRWRRDRAFVLASAALAYVALAALGLWIHVRVAADATGEQPVEDLLFGYTWASRFGALPCAMLYVWTAMVVERLSFVVARPIRGPLVLVLVFGFACGDNLRNTFPMRRLAWPEHAAMLEDARARAASPAYDPEINPIMAPEVTPWALRVSLLGQLARRLEAPSNGRGSNPLPVPGIDPRGTLRISTPARARISPARHWRRIRIRASVDGGESTVSLRLLGVTGGVATELARVELRPGGAGVLATELAEPPPEELAFEATSETPVRLLLVGDG